MKLEPPLLKSLALHLVVITSLFVSVDFSADDMPTPMASAPVIKATFIDAQAIADKKREEDRQRAAQRKKVEEAAAAKRRVEQQRKKREQEKKRAEAKRQQELKRKAAAEAKRKRELQEAKQREAEQRAEEARKQQELERLMEQQIAEERRTQQARRSQQVLSEVDRYRVEIQQTIMRYLIDDPDFKGKRCKLNLRLASTGLVTQVVIREGEPALCRAARSAVLRPDKLPVSDDPDVYEQLKNINLTVEL